MNPKLRVAPSGPFISGIAGQILTAQADGGVKFETPAAPVSGGSPTVKQTSSTEMTTTVAPVEYASITVATEVNQGWLIEFPVNLNVNLGAEELLHMAIQVMQPGTFVWDSVLGSEVFIVGPVVDPYKQAFLSGMVKATATGDIAFRVVWTNGSATSQQGAVSNLWCTPATVILPA